MLAFFRYESKYFDKDYRIFFNVWVLSFITTKKTILQLEP